MSTSIKLIKYTSILSIVFLIITYLITVNIESEFIQFNTIWISNNFLLTIFGGAYASILVVLLCEIHKYINDKKSTEVQLFYQALYLYQALFMMQQNVLDYQKHSDMQIPDNLLDNTTHMVNSQVYCLRSIDYTTFCKKNEITKIHNAFKKSDFFPIENGVYKFKRAVLEEKIDKYMTNQYNPNVIIASDKKVSVMLAQHISIISSLLKEVEIYLNTIDQTCNNKFNWNELREKINNSYISLFEKNNE